MSVPKSLKNTYTWIGLLNFVETDSQNLRMARYVMAPLIKIHHQQRSTKDLNNTPKLMSNIHTCKRLMNLAITIVNFMSLDESLLPETHYIEISNLLLFLLSDACPIYCKTPIIRALEIFTLFASSKKTQKLQARKKWEVSYVYQSI